MIQNLKWAQQQTILIYINIIRYNNIGYRNVLSNKQ